MNTAWERALASCRANLSSDLDKAAMRASKLREDARNNSERLRASLTLGATHTYRGRPDKCREEFEQAVSRYSRPGPLARSDLAVHWGQLHLFNEELDSAIIEAERAVDLAGPLASSSPTLKHRYNVVSVVPRAAYGAALLTRAEVRLRQDLATAALSDTTLALSWVDPRFSAYLHVAGLTMLGRILVTPGVATSSLASEALILCRRAHRLLGAIRIPAKAPQRVKVRGLEALALGVLGSGQKAEAMLAKTIRQLMAAGLEKDASLFMEHMIWLVATRAGQFGRARMLAARYGLPASAVPKPQKPPPPEDDDEPIGF